MKKLQNNSLYRRYKRHPFFTLLLGVLMYGCVTPTEPGITPPTARFVKRSVPPQSVDHGFYSDIAFDAIVVEWYSDSTRLTTGYELYRSETDRIGSDGLLDSNELIRRIESPNTLFQPLDTLYRDTTARIGKRYYYQIRPYNKSQSNRLTYGEPSKVSDTTSYMLIDKVRAIAPNDITARENLEFTWQDNEHGGAYQIIVLDAATLQSVWSSSVLQVYNNLSISYNIDTLGVPKDQLPAGEYMWRIKKLTGFGGSSSNFLHFRVK